MTEREPREPRGAPCPRCGMPQEGPPGKPCPRCLLTTGLESGPEPPGSVQRKGAEEERIRPAPGDTLLGRYTVLEEVGEGGMSVVLAAYDARLDRRVALKLLRTRKAVQGEDWEARLEREAQAMARLNHPQVVQVYDAGALEDGSLFIAMEYVEGQTLRQWGEARPRSWREVLEVYLAAGRGLAAAHEAGLVHRDFKPDNVLVGRDGRVRVTDFGLVGAGLSAGPLEELPTGAWSGSLTQPGTVPGTPRYMAPELLQGQPADVRSDLYAFCVALYEALYGQSPFTGEDGTESPEALLQRRVEPPPARSEVPEWVARVVLQGLRADPEQRPASLGELLAALEDDPEVRRRTRLRTAALACAGGLLAALALWGWLRQEGPACDDLGTRLAGVWDGEVRGRVEAAALGTGLPYARDTARLLSLVLEDYARDWVERSTRVCEAMREQAGPSQGLTALQAHCLEERRSQLQALTTLLARGPDPELLPRAVKAARLLPPLEDCSDARALKAAVPPPEEPLVREQVEHLQRQVDRLETLYRAGKYQEGLALEAELWPRVEPVAYAPLKARALFWGAMLREGSGAYEEAEEKLWEAIELAARGGSRVQLARAWSQLALVAGERRARLHPEEALLLEKVLEFEAEAADDDQVRIESLEKRGVLLYKLGRYEEARERYARALALAEERPGPEHPSVATLLNAQGNVFKEMGRYEESEQYLERALALWERLLGPEHPHVAIAHHNLSAVLKELGRYEEAREQQARALASWERLLGPEHPYVTSAHNNLGILLEAMGRYEEALPQYEHVRVQFEKRPKTESFYMIVAHTNLCGVLRALGRYAEAEERCAHALTLLKKRPGTPPMVEVPLLSHWGYLLVKRGQYEKARQNLERALALAEETLGPEHPTCSQPLLGLGELLLARGRPAQALPLLTQALQLAPPESRSEVRFLLAQALWDSEGDRQRALAEATQVRDEYQRLGHSRLAEVQRWLAARK